MLYISRLISGGSYGVVDTDDDVEEVVTSEELRTIAGNLGIPITGVTVGNGVVGHMIRNVEVYQDPRYCTLLQTKTKTLLGVDVRIFRGEVVYIAVSETAHKGDIRIRISDFAPKLCGFTPIIRSRGMPDMTLTLVFDDKVELVGGLFKIGGPGVRIDISEVTNNRFADAVYRFYSVKNDISVDKLRDFVIDKGDRGIYWHCVCLVNSPVNEAVKAWESLKDKSCIPEATARLEKMYWWEFADLAHKDIETTFFSSLSDEDFIDFAKGFLKDVIDVHVGCRNYEQAREVFPHVGQLLRVASTINSKSVLRFENFVKFFPASADTQELCVNFCNNVCKAVVSYTSKCKSMG